MVASFFMGLKLKNIDLIWGTSPPIFQGMTAWALARLKRVPFLFEVRDLWPAFAISAGVLKNGILIRASEWLEKFLYRGADRVMVNSPGYIDHVKNKGAEQIELLTNGVDVGMFDPAQRGESFRASHHLQDKFALLYAGAHGMSNDLEILLDSAKLLEDSPNIHILLLGDGKEKANLQAKAQKMGLKNLSFLPSVPKNEMAEAIAGADACLAPSFPPRAKASSG
jgi:glycosyltransferase involved in cell wall biosynthesis